MRRWFTNLGMLQVFISSLLVIVIMFVSTYYIYRNLISDIYGKVSENNGLVVQSIVQSFDDSFRNVNNIIYSIHRLPPHDTLAPALNNRSKMMKVQELVKNLSTLVSTVDYIEEVVVFDDSSNMAVTSRGTIDFDLLFNHKYKHEAYNADYWRAYSKTQHPFKLFPTEEYEILQETNQQTRHVKLIVAVADNKMSTSNKDIMVIIDSDALMQRVNRQPMIPGSTLTMLDQERNMIYSTGKPLDLVDILNEKGINLQAEGSWTREDYEYNFYYSDYNHYIYIEKVPFRFQNLGAVERANYLIMLLAAVSAVIISVFTSIYMHRPVKKIIRLLGGDRSKGDDFRKIYSGIVKLQSENEVYRDQISHYDAEMRRNTLLQAWDGQLHHKKFDFQIQRHYTRLFSEKYFVMVKFEVDFVGNGSAEQAKPVEDIEELLQSSLEQEGLAGIVVYAYSGFIALIGQNAESERGALLRRLRIMITKLKDSELGHYTNRASVSRLYASEMNNCRAAFVEVNNVSLHRHVNDHSVVLDTETIRSVWNVYLPFEKLEKLSNCILAGKMEESAAIIGQTIQENVDRNVHYYQLVHIAKTIFFYLINFAGGLADAPKELHELERSFLGQIEQQADSKQMEKALIRAAQYFSMQSKGAQKNKLNAVHISQYIELNYMKDLYLDHIAEVMETTPKYFSYFFKKSFGVNYVEYLNKVRLSHARELLKTTNASVTEIAEKTGYSNLSSFTITFKKYMGVSPTDYRKQVDL
ncbi:helix-turn-helix domain-containing protein [Paenibacillus agaridevorans]|uniref:helix-turn-helix domain-containing protein n=1 Tax=Paenibacillus agaridevorans TaxID=171404 RepID=UPI001BE4BD04|nr:helix-turn-helix domain-containing protein [Paenibacillus agaridevorans]